jgi:hypothetical protein
MILDINKTYILQGNNVAKTLEIQWLGYGIDECQCFVVLPNKDYLPLTDRNIKQLKIKP